MSESTFAHCTVSELEILTNPASEDLQEDYLDSLALIHDELCASAVDADRPRFDATERSSYFFKIMNQFENQMQNVPGAAGLYSKMTRNWNQAIADSDQVTGAEPGIRQDLVGRLLNAVLWEFQVVSEMRRFDPQSDR
jgi:hypothetical protein